jgi:hypothetical protein
VRAVAVALSALAVLSAASAAAETRWVGLGSNITVLVDSEKMRWVQIRGTSEAAGMSEGNEFQTKNSADVAWLRRQVADKAEWIEVDPIKGSSSSFDRFYRWSAIRAIKRSSGDLDMWSLDQPLDRPPDVRATRSADVNRILALAKLD